MRPYTPQALCVVAPKNFGDALIDCYKDLYWLNCMLLLISLIRCTVKRRTMKIESNNCLTNAFNQNASDQQQFGLNHILYSVA